MEDPDKLVSVTDPSETNRQTHNRGDRAVLGLGNIAAWLFPILMLCITAQVFLRQAGNNQAWLDDLQWWLYGIACLLGIAYAVATNSHVQVDIFYENYDEQKRKRTDLFGLGWLLLPFSLIAWDTTLHYSISSVLANEGSDSPNGLHNLWFLKVLVNLCFIVLIVAVLSRIWRILDLNGQGTWWHRFKWTLPGTAFAMNLLVFYAAWWATRLTQPDMNPRSIARNGYLMTEIEYGPYETALTVIVSLALTALLGLVLFLRRTR